MTKIILNPVVGTYGASLINQNFDALKDALDNKVLFRDNPDGNANEMKKDLDMNSHRILNLPAPIGPNEPARKADILSMEQVSQAVVDSQAAADRAEAVATELQAKKESVSVRDFGAKGDGVTDDTAAVIAANAASLALLFPSGYTFNLSNWQPRANTKIVATGATIQRGSTAVFVPTASSAALVVVNDRVEIVGGKWQDAPNLARSTFSGSILLEGGSDFSITQAEITSSWGGIVGPEVQNSGHVSKRVRIQNNWIHHCDHNTYLADIDGLLFNGNVSEYSQRDGLRTYRNVQNITVTGNLIRNCGDGTVGQSQDAIDLFIAGHTCIISNNVLQNCSVKGIDIKRNNTTSEPLQNQKFIIANNVITGMGDVGIEIEVSGLAGSFVDFVNIQGNYIAGCANRGIKTLSMRNSRITNNIVTGNTGDGIRTDGSDCVSIVSNTITANTGVGINNVTGTGTLISLNQIRGAHSIGISTAEGVCRNNDVVGATSAYSAGTAVRGQEYTSAYSKSTATQIIGLAKKGVVTAVEIFANDFTVVSDITVSKRNAATGAFSANITTNPATSLPTAYVSVLPALSGSTSQKTLAGGEVLTLTLANITDTGSFTGGMVRVHYID